MQTAAQPELNAAIRRFAGVSVMAMQNESTLTVAIIDNLIAEHTDLQKLKLTTAESRMISYIMLALNSAREICVGKGDVVQYEEHVNRLYSYCRLHAIQMPPERRVLSPNVKKFAEDSLEAIQNETQLFGVINEQLTEGKNLLKPEHTIADRKMVSYIMAALKTLRKICDGKADKEEKEKFFGQLPAHCKNYGIKLPKQQQGLSPNVRELFRDSVTDMQNESTSNDIINRLSDRAHIILIGPLTIADHNIMSSIIPALKSASKICSRTGDVSEYDECVDDLYSYCEIYDLSISSKQRNLSLVVKNWAEKSVRALQDDRTSTDILNRLVNEGKNMNVPESIENGKIISCVMPTLRSARDICSGSREGDKHKENFHILQSYFKDYAIILPVLKTRPEQRLLHLSPDVINVAKSSLMATKNGRVPHNISKLIEITDYYMAQENLIGNGTVLSYIKPVLESILAFSLKGGNQTVHAQRVKDLLSCCKDYGIQI